MTYDEALKATQPMPSGEFVGLSGRRDRRQRIDSSPTSGPVSDRTGTSSRMTLDPPAEHGQEIAVVYFTDSCHFGEPGAGPRRKQRWPNPSQRQQGRARAQRDPLRSPRRCGGFHGHRADLRRGRCRRGGRSPSPNPITVSGAPTIGLTVGTTTRTATWKTGQGAGTSAPLRVHGGRRRPRHRRHRGRGTQPRCPGGEHHRDDGRAGGRPALPRLGPGSCAPGGRGAPELRGAPPPPDPR